MNNQDFEAHLLATEEGITPNYETDNLTPCYYVSNMEVDLSDYIINYGQTSLSYYNVRGWSESLRLRLKENFKTVIPITWHKDKVCQVLSEKRIYETA
jgi:hypothetical protein